MGEQGFPGMGITAAHGVHEVPKLGITVRRSGGVHTPDSLTALGKRRVGPMPAVRSRAAREVTETAPNRAVASVGGGSRTGRRRPGRQLREVERRWWIPREVSR